MTMKSTKTLKPADCDIKWYLIDATDLVLGRLASQIATIIRGKNKPSFSPSQDCGDYVVVINADKIQLTGKKLESKQYFHHSGYIGGIHAEAAKDLIKEKPERLLIKAVERMISRNSLGAKQMTKLRVFAGSEHPHAAQNPIVLDIGAKNRKNKRSV